MSKASQSTTRRQFLTNAAAVPIITAGAATALFDDPIYTALEAHRATQCEFDAAQAEFSRAEEEFGSTSPQADAIWNGELNRAMVIEREECCRLIATTPTTLAGLHALAAYVASEHRRGNDILGPDEFDVYLDTIEAGLKPLAAASGAA